MPSVLPRVVIIPSEKKDHTTVTLLEQIIERNIDKLFLSYDVICAHPYRIMRNADLPIDEDEAEDLLVEIQKQLKKRQWGEVIRLEVEDKMDPRLLDILKMEFQVHGDDIFFINGPLDLTMLMNDGELAVCFMNRTENSWKLDYDWKKQTIYFADEVNIHRKEYKIRDLWQHKDIGTTKRNTRHEIPAHGVLMVRLTPIK